MIKHLLILIWNSKKNYLGILIEQALIFVILMFWLSCLYQVLHEYTKPGLLDTENVVSLGYMAQPHIRANSPKMTGINKSVNAITDFLRKQPYVHAVSEGTSFIPYLRASEYYKHDTLVMLRQKVAVKVKTTDPHAINVFNFTVSKGQWFPEKWQNKNAQPAIITQQLAYLLQLENPIGSFFEINKRRYTIIGTMAGIKSNVFDDPEPTVILPYERNPYTGYREISLKIDADAFDQLYADYSEEFQRLINTSGVEPFLFDLNNIKKETIFPTTSSIKLQLIPTCFLFIFAFIGTFGLFMLNTKKRESELALRIALGSTRKQLLQFILLQGLLITILASIPGVILAIIVYDFNLINFLALLTAWVTLMLFSLLSAYYPSYKISKINPSSILYHE